MCTAIYIPGKDNVVIASLRDESPARQRASEPVILESEGTKFVMPVDPQGGGSWVGLNKHGVAVVLLNGAFERHHHQPPYRMSRGLIVRALLASQTPVDVWNAMPMEGIEPYTLVALQSADLYKLTWDGVAKYNEVLDSNVAHILSSTTLYHQAARTKRTDMFSEWLETRPHVSEGSLMEFFRSVSDPDNGFLMNRGIVKTLSYSYLTLNKDTYEFYYSDLAENEARLVL